MRRSCVCSVLSKSLGTFDPVTLRASMAGVVHGMSCEEASLVGHRPSCRVACITGVVHGEESRISLLFKQ
jgi:hypothetical protein